MWIVKIQSSTVFLACLIGCVSSGCGHIHSQNPLSDRKTPTPDRRLIGSWYSTDLSNSEQSAYLHIGLVDELVDVTERDWNFENREVAEKILERNPKQFDKYMRATRVIFHESQISSQSGLFLPTKVGQSCYVSYPSYEQRDGKITLDYSFWKYDLEGDNLTLWEPADIKSVLVNAIKQGKLKGEVITVEIGGEIPHLTESTDNLLRYLKTEGDAEIAKKPGTRFRRINPSAGVPDKQ